MRPKSFRTFEKRAPGACFSKVPKLFGSLSGATIPFISSQRRGSKHSNFAILLIFLILKTCKKIIFSKQADCSLTNSFSGPKSSRDFRETGPRPGVWMLVERFQTSAENPILKLLPRAITTGANSWINQSEFPAVTCNLLKTRSWFWFSLWWVEKLAWEFSQSQSLSITTAISWLLSTVVLKLLYLLTKAFVLFLASTSRMDIATGVTQGKLFPNRQTTFLTVSDVPMQLSKPFQLAQQMNQNTSQAARKSPPNVEQYQYDFTLEKNVLHGHW